MLWVNADVPLARFIVFDDRIGIGGYDNGIDMLAVYVDTDTPVARDWADATVTEQ